MLFPTLRLAREQAGAYFRAYYEAEKTARNLSENTSLDTGVNTSKAPRPWSTNSRVLTMIAPHGVALVFNYKAMAWLSDHNAQVVRVPEQQDIEAIELAKFEPNDAENAKRRARLTLGLTVDGDSLDADRIPITLDATAPVAYRDLPDKWKAHIDALAD